MIHDMTEGSPTKQLCLFSVPMMINMMFQQLYTIVNGIVAGQFAGTAALAAVGASDAAIGIFNAFAIGCNVGCSVVISQLFGSHRFRDMKTAINTALIAAMVLSCSLTLIGQIICDPLLRILQVPSDIFFDAAAYFRIYVCVMPFLFLYNICTGIFTALGDSKTPLYFLIASSVGNILLALLFVGVFRWGAVGTACGTLLSQLISSLAIFFVLRKRIVPIATEGDPDHFSWSMLGAIAKISVPSIFQASFVSVGNLFVQGQINAAGTDALAGFVAAFKIHSFSNNALNALANGLSNFAAQNLGAGKWKRVRTAFYSGCGIAAVSALLFTAAYVIFCRPLVGIFLSDPTPLAMQTGMNYLYIVAPFYVVVAIKLMADGVLRGAGCTYMFMTTTFSDLIVRVILAFVLPSLIWNGQPLGVTGIWCAWPVGWIVGTALAVVFYFSGTWKRKHIL